MSSIDLGSWSVPSSALIVRQKFRRLAVFAVLLNGIGFFFSTVPFFVVLAIVFLSVGPDASEFGSVDSLALVVSLAPDFSSFTF